LHGAHFPQKDLLNLPETSVEMPLPSSDGRPALRTVPEECPIALVCGGTTAAAAMATPADLSGFVIGFSLTEGIVKDISEIDTGEIVPNSQLRMWLTSHSGRQFCPMIP
jgi:FdhD protein